MTTPRSDTTRAILRRAGWYAGRAVPTEAAESLLAGSGYPVSAAARAALSEFHGLRLETPGGGATRVDFDVREAIGFTTREVVATCERIVGEPLCPLGTASAFSVLVAPSARVLSLAEHVLLVLVHRNVAEALEWMCDINREPYATFWLESPR